MSKYTTQVRYICEEAAGLTESKGYNSVKEILVEAAPKVFDFDFPIFDEAYRLPLEIKILKHFYTREIGLETVGLWKLKLDTKLNEIMPYYNKLYESELLAFNPLFDTDIIRQHKLNRTENQKDVGKVDMTEDFSREDNGTSDTMGSTNITNDSTTNSTGNVKNVDDHVDKFSDTPQGSLQNIAADTYLTNARMINDTTNQDTTTTSTGKDTSDSSTEQNVENYNETEATTDRTTNTTNNRDITSMDEYIETIKGKQPGVSFSKLLSEFRSTFLNIDMMIVKELNELFMQLW